MAEVWTEDMIEQVRTMAAQGMSASHIAKQIAIDGARPVSRNSVVGIGHRKGISFHGGHGGGAHRKPKPKPKPEGKLYAKLKIKLPMIETEPPRTGMLTIMELVSDSCRFPHGDPLHPDFRYCGQRKLDEFPYCPEHCRISYETPEQRRENSQGTAGENRGFGYPVRDRRNF